MQTVQSWQAHEFLIDIPTDAVFLQDVAADVVTGEVSLCASMASMTLTCSDNWYHLELLSLQQSIPKVAGVPLVAAPWSDSHKIVQRLILAFIGRHASSKLQSLDLSQDCSVSHDRVAFPTPSSTPQNVLWP